MHRLDTDTSGCLLFARNAKARRDFQQAFEGAPVEKYYLAVVAAEIAEERGRDRRAAGQDLERRGGLADGPDDAWPEATTHWRRLAVRDGATLVEFRPMTGRTHQIRAHAREAFGRGIVGDRVYGMPGGPMLLHASRLVVPREGKPTIDVTGAVA